MRFLAFEGLDGSGKSTLISGLKKELEGRGFDAVVSREPGGTPLGNDIRHLLLRVDGQAPVPRAEALLYQADRAQHVETVIRPALARGAWVLSDRYAASSIAFQSGGRAIAEENIKWLNAFSTDGLKPDLYVLLELPVEESLRRIGGRGDSDRFERESKEFHERIRAAYHAIAAEDQGRWLIVSSVQTPQKILADVLQKLKERSWLD